MTRKSRSVERDFLFQTIMEQIAIQGIAGCYHETAARGYFADREIEVLPCLSFDELFARMAADPALLGIAAGLLVTLVMVAVAQIAPGVPQLADLMGNFSWQTMLFASVAGLAIILVMLSVTMPLFSRFGMTKGVRYLPLLIIIGVFFAFQLDGNGPPPEFVANVLNLLESPAGTIAIAAGVLAITAAVYAISAVISTKLYQKREL